LREFYEVLVQIYTLRWRGFLIRAQIENKKSRFSAGFSLFNFRFGVTPVTPSVYKILATKRIKF
jgi:hypothetical protein